MLRICVENFEHSAEQNEGHKQYWCSFSSCSWVGGWMGGWMEVKAVLRIAYSNQKYVTTFMINRYNKKTENHQFLLEPTILYRTIFGHHLV
jgi:hypothetical protein